MARWFKGKPNGKPPPDAHIIQLALEFHTTPDVIENMDVFWFNRMTIWMEAKAKSDKIK